MRSCQGLPLMQSAKHFLSSLPYVTLLPLGWGWKRFRQYSLSSESSNLSLARRQGLLCVACPRLPFPNFWQSRLGLSYKLFYFLDRLLPAAPQSCSCYQLLGSLSPFVRSQKVLHHYLS